MLIDVLRENPSFVELEEKKQEKDRLEAAYDSIAEEVHSKGGDLYHKLEELILKEIDKRREQYLSKDTGGLELAMKLCSYDIHPWAKRTKYTVQYVSRGDKYYSKNHKRIPKYYIEHCPICGKILCTQKRIYRMGKREIVDIPLEEFERRAPEFGYFQGALERYTMSLPIYSMSGGKLNMASVLRQLMVSQPPEISSIMQEILDYWNANDDNNHRKTVELQSALNNAEELCKIFGHDVRSIDSRCKCCGRRFSKEQLLSDYKNAALSGVVDFPYLHGDMLLLPTEENEDSSPIFLRFL